MNSITRLFRWLMVFQITLFSQYSLATHIMGGELSYRCNGFDITNNKASYTIELNFYRYCIFSNDTTAPLPLSLGLEIFADNSLRQDTFPLFETESMAIIYDDSVSPPFNGPNCPFAPDICVQHGLYSATIELPLISGDYHLCVSTRARNGTIQNILDPLLSGIVFYATIPPNNLQNNSAYFTELPLPYICISDTISFVNNATDEDGDVLRYRFVSPIESVNRDSTDLTYPMVLPFNSIIYNTGYSISNPFGPGSFASIDSTTGLTKLYLVNQGFYVIAIEVSEYRNGVLISRTRRDYQIIGVVCPPNNSPSYVAPISHPSTNYTVTEGDTLCIQTVFIDTDNDSIKLSASGEVFNAGYINPKATFLSSKGLGTVSGDFCWLTQCGYARGTPYQFIISASDDGCPQKKKDIIFSITVTPRSVLLPSPTVDFSFTPPDPFCPRTEVTFLIAATNTGAFPVYQWRINGEAISSDSTFITSALKNNDVVSLSLKSSTTCAFTDTAEAMPYTFSVFDEPVADFSFQPESPDELHSLITFTNQSTGSIFYTWKLSDGTKDSAYNFQHAFSDTGSYNVMLIASNMVGCIDSVEKKIEIKPVPTVYVPLAFTPNNDGVNDFFIPVFNSYDDFELIIFNRWGMKIFSTNSISTPWYGNSLRSGFCPQGMYIYHLVLNTEGKTKTINGNINLIR